MRVLGSWAKESYQDHKSVHDPRFGLVVFLLCSGHVDANRLCTQLAPSEWKTRLSLS